MVEGLTKSNFLKGYSCSIGSLAANFFTLVALHDNRGKNLEHTATPFPGQQDTGTIMHKLGLWQ